MLSLAVVVASSFKNYICLGGGGYFIKCVMIMQGFLLRRGGGKN